MVLENSEFNKSIKGTNAQLRLAKAELKNAGSQVNLFGRDSERLGSVQESLSKQVELHSKKVDLYKQSIEKTTTKMNDNIKERDKLGSSLEKANKKYDEAVRLYGKESEQAKKAKEEVDRLTEEYNKKEKAIESNAKSIQRYEENLNKAEAEMAKTQGELKKINEELAKNENKWIKASDKLKKHSEKLKETGDKINSLGNEILKLTAPIAAVGIAGAKMSTDLNKGMAQIATLIPQQQERLQELKGDIQDVAIIAGKGTDDIAAGTYDVISAYGDAADTMEKVEINAKAAAAGMAETSDALNLSSAVMKGYGDTTAEANEKVMDLSFMTVKLGQTSFPDLAASIGKVVPQSNELKITQEELFAVFATGTGVTGNASEVSTQYQGVLKALMAPTKDMTSLMKKMGYADGEAMIAKEGLGGAIKVIVDESKKTGKPLQKYIGSIQGQTLALALAGEQSEVYEDKLKQLKNSSGAMEEAFNEQANGINKTGFTYQQAMVKMQVATQKLGDAMGPMLAKGADLISDVADKLANMSEEQMESIVHWGKMAIVSGGALKVIGGGISTIGKLAGGLSWVTGKIGEATLATEGASVAAEGVSLATSGAAKGVGILGTVTKAGALVMNPWVIGIGAATVGGIALAKHLKEDAVPAVELFSDNISEGTQKSINEFLELDEKATLAMNQMNWNGQGATKELVEVVVENVEGMREQVVGALEQQKEESLKTTQDTLDGLLTINLDEKKEILEVRQEMYDEQIMQTNHSADMIISIEQTALEEKRELSEGEKRVINGLKEDMVKRGIEVLSQGEKEQLEILNNLKDQSGLITARQAADTVKTSAQQKNRTIREAKEERDRRLELARDLRKKGGKENIEMANTIEAEAKRGYLAAKENAEKMHNDVVSEAKKQAGEHAKSIDWETGEVKKKWQRLIEWFKNNPVVRFIKTKNDERVENKSGSNAIRSNKTPNKRWTGDRYFKGGLTYLHDRPGNSTNYELYDLPRGTRIYNHDASQDLVMKTAEQVANKVANSVLKNAQGGPNGVTVVQHIYSKTDSPAETQRLSRKEYQKLTFTMN